MTTAKARGQKLSTWATGEYAHQVETSARAVGMSVSAYVRLALDRAMSIRHHQRLSSLTACGLHAELGRLHVRLETQSDAVSDATAVAIGEHLSRVEALMLTLTDWVHHEIDL